MLFEDLIKVIRKINAENATENFWLLWKMLLKQKPVGLRDLRSKAYYENMTDKI